MNPTPPIPAPEGEVPPRIFVGRQWADERFKSGTWRKEQAAFYAVPFVPEATLSAEKQRGLRAVEEARAEEKAKAVAHVNAVQCLLAGRLPRGESWQFLTDAWNLNARFLCGENSDTQTEYLRQSRAAKEPS